LDLIVLPRSRPDVLSRLSRIAAITLIMPLASAIGQEGDASKGGVKGTVRDSSGRAIIGVQVSLPGASVRIETDGNGQFQLAKVRPGMLTMRFLRLGYRPDTVSLLVIAGRIVPLDVTLSMLPRQLSPVVVQGRSDLTGWRRDYYQRRDLGGGHFITRDDIDKRNPGYVTDMFRVIPGVQIRPGQGVIRNQVRFRGNAVCAPLTWLDGAPLAAGEFDLDGIVPRSIEAIEIYTGSTVPPRFAVAPGIGPRTCGAIIIWSREGERRAPRRTTNVSPAAEVAALVDAREVFTAAQVDITAHQDSLRPVRPVYPDALYEALVGGSVMAEFIVSPVGTVDVERMSVVFATHPQFAAAVRDALESAVYVPAFRDGYPVHQVVQHEFRFVPDSGRRKR
jgi:hypothetical protein